jgi:hypothetical protein
LSDAFHNCRCRRSIVVGEVVLVGTPEACHLLQEAPASVALGCEDAGHEVALSCSALASQRMRLGREPFDQRYRSLGIHERGSGEERIREVTDAPCNQARQADEIGKPVRGGYRGRSRQAPHLLRGWTSDLSIEEFIRPYCGPQDPESSFRLWHLLSLTRRSGLSRQDAGTVRTSPQRQPDRPGPLRSGRRSVRRT